MKYNISNLNNLNSSNHFHLSFYLCGLVIMGKKERMRKNRNKKPLPKSSPTTIVDSNGKHHRHPDYPDDEDWPVTPDYYRLGPPPNDIFHDDVCSICFDAVSLLNTETYVEYTCCGKCMHQKCAVKLMKVQYKKKMYSCPMCRAQNVDRGSKIHIERLQQVRFFIFSYRHIIYYYY